MRTEDMNQGVQILLERMKSNPEEFIPDWRNEYPSKWRLKLEAVTRRVQHIQANRKDEDYYTDFPFLCDEEILALWHAMQNLLADRFTQEVMATLLEGDEPRELSFTSHKAIGESPKTIHAILEEGINEAFKDAYAKYAKEVHKHE